MSTEGEWRDGLVKAYAMDEMPMKGQRKGMKLWILRPIEDHPAWEPWYDKAFGFVVRAESESEARRVAQENGGEECYRGKDGYGTGKSECWTDPSAATCVELSADGHPGLVMTDFAAA